jgi:hypothetical protein
MEEAAKRTRTSDDACLGALRVVAREGWLCKPGWSISKAVHAFAKPIRVVVGGSIDRATTNAVLARPLITVLRLQGEFGSRPPLPACLRELELSEFCGPLHELPPTLTSLVASDWPGVTGVVALVSALEAAPAGLHELTLHRKQHEKKPEEDELEDVQCPAGVRKLNLRGVGWRMRLPSQLQTLTLRCFILTTELRLPDTVRQLHLTQCSLRDNLVLNEGLLRLELHRKARSRVPLQLPSTLAHLVMDATSNAPLAQPSPASLKFLKLDDDFDSPLGPLPGSLEELIVGREFSQPLGQLPLGLLSLLLDTSEYFNEPLGELPAQLRTLQLSECFDQPLGPLPPDLRSLTVGEEFNAPLGLWPDSLEELTAGVSFREPLGPLPLGLRSLLLGESDYFDQPLGELPAQLCTLQLSECFDQPLGPLPQSLERLETGFGYSHPLPLPLPRACVSCT